MERERLSGASIKALIARMVGAWNKGDLAAFASEFASDGSLINQRGIWRGLRNIERHYRDDGAELGRLEADATSIFCPEPVGGESRPKLAEALTSWQVIKPEGITGGYSLMTFVEEAGRVRIRHEMSVITHHSNN